MNGGVLSNPHVREPRVASVLHHHRATTFASVEPAPVCVLVLKVEGLPIAH